MASQRELARQPRSCSAAPQAADRRRVVAAASAGVVGPIVFAVVAFGHGALRADHDLVTLPISALAAGPSGWIQDVNFLVLGVCMIALAAGLHHRVEVGHRLAAGLHHRVEAGHRTVLAPAFLAASGVGLVWAALFPATDAAGAFTDARVLHTVAPVMVFAGAGSGLILMARRMGPDARWRDLAAYTRLSGVAILVLLLAGGGLARPPGAPLHAWLGLYQWLLLVVWFPCMIVLACRLMRVARSPQGPA